MRRLSAGLLAGLLLAATASSAPAGYDPKRPTYDYNRYDPTRQDCVDPSNAAADHGRCGPNDGPVFNSFINTPSYGDERAFYDGRLSSRSTSGSHTDVIDVSDAIGSNVTLRIYVNNDANEQFGYRTTASGAFVRVSLPAGAARALRSRAYIGAQNAIPGLVDDTVELVSRSRFRVQYISGTARLRRHDKSYRISDAIVTTGAPIGGKRMNGSYPAGFDEAAVIEFEVGIAAAATQATSLAAWISAIAALIVLIGLMLYPKTRAWIVCTTKALWSALIGAPVRDAVIAGVVLAAVLGLVKLFS